MHNDVLFLALACLFGSICLAIVEVFLTLSRMLAHLVFLLVHDLLTGLEWLLHLPDQTVALGALLFVDQGRHLFGADLVETSVHVGERGAFVVKCPVLQQRFLLILVLEDTGQVRGNLAFANDHRWLLYLLW